MQSKFVFFLFAQSLVTMYVPRCLYFSNQSKLLEFGPSLQTQKYV